MSYVPLSLDCANAKIKAAVSVATEPHLEQAHYLLALTYPNAGPSGHFGKSAAIMMLLTIAAASAIRYLNPNTNKKKSRDRTSFIDCVSTFFPWDHVTIADDQHRSIWEQRKAAAVELYDVFRNPLVHSGGVTGKWHLSGVVGNWHRGARINHSFPGMASPQENEKQIADLCGMASCDGQMLIELTATASTVHTKPLYWCTRKMIEAFAANSAVQKDIAQNLGI